MAKELDIRIVKTRCDGDGVTALYIDKKLHTQGDYYHDKIDEWIDGWCEGLKYANVAHRIAHYAIPSTDDDEEDYEPPDVFNPKWEKHRRKS